MTDDDKEAIRRAVAEALAGAYACEDISVVGVEYDERSQGVTVTITGPAHLLAPLSKVNHG
jgi:hypothetical protein